MIMFMKHRIWGFSALLVASIALVSAIIAYHVLKPPSHPSSGIKFTAKFNMFGSEKTYQYPAQAEPPEQLSQQAITRDTMENIAIGISIVAIVLAVMSWIRKEGFWLGVIAVVVAATTWKYSWIAKDFFFVIIVLLLFDGGYFLLIPIELMIEKRRKRKMIGEITDRSEESF